MKKLLILFTLFSIVSVLTLSFLSCSNLSSSSNLEKISPHRQSQRQGKVGNTTRNHDIQPSDYKKNFLKNIVLFQEKDSHLNSKVLVLAFKAYQHARKLGIDDKKILTIIDYSKPSTEKRLWVFDINSQKILFNTWVSHAKNSGLLNAFSFSNQPGSLKSSLGVFLTDNSPYFGGKGYALRINGLEKGINDNAYKRAIVFHGAQYVNANNIHKYGRIGRSFGCLAVNPTIVKSLINTIKEHTLVFAYYPNQTWLTHSKFLN